MAETPLERYQRKVAETYVPTWEEYQATHPEAAYKGYLEAYSAIAAQKQVAAGEIPSEYGAGYSFTPMGYWAPSGSLATIGGLPGEIRGIFPGVQSAMETDLERGYQQSVMSRQEEISQADIALNTGSTAGEPQTSFAQLPNVNPPISSIGGIPGGSAPVAYTDPGNVPQSTPQTGVGGIAPFAAFGQNGNGNGNGETGGLGLLALLAIALGAGL